MKSALPRHAIAVLATAGLVIAGFWSMLVAFADYYASRQTVAGTEKALALMPNQAIYHYRLGLLLSDRDPQRAEQAVRRAVALSPGSHVAWIWLGLRAEMAGDTSEAERDLLRAAEVDKEYLPSWTLANFYFRRNDQTRFWLWAKSAAQMLYGDPLPLFRLCGAVAEDGKLLERLDILEPRIQAAYLSYLLSNDRVNLIGPAAARLADQRRPDDVPLLLMACDRMMNARNVDGALALWNRMAAKKSISSLPLSAAAEQVFANESFVTPPLSQGFDWRLPAPGGVDVSREEDPPGLRLTFTGRQPEECTPLYRLVPVIEKAGYEFGISYRTYSVQPNTGLTWRVTDAISGALLAASENMASESSARVAVDFVTPAGCGLVKLALAYRRTSGTTRIEGSIAVREAGLKRVQLPISGRVMK
jgi:hypothetical protein